MKKMKPVPAWAWAIDDGGKPELCHWAEPSKELLLRQSKPSPEAKPVKVLIMPYSRELIK